MLLWERKKEKVAPQPYKSQREQSGLSLIERKDVTVENIASLLKKGFPIWAWYIATDMAATNATATEIICHAMETYSIDHYQMYRADGDYINKYYSHIKNGNIILKLDTICRLKKTNIMEIVNDDLSLANEVYYDTTAFTEDTLAYILILPTLKQALEP